MNQRMRFTFWAPAILLLASFATAQTYTITDLGTFAGGTASQGYAVNRSGQVAGYSRDSLDATHGFIWSPNQGLQPLPAIPPQTNFAVAEAINSFGTVAGYSDYNESEQEHAVIWINRKITDLGTLPGGTISEATGINDVGQVTGFSNGTNISPNAFVWTDSQGMQNLGTLAGGYYSQGLAINLQGQVAGYSNASDGEWHAFLWSSTTGMQALPNVPGGGSASGNAINDLGQVAGGSGSDAVIWNSAQSVENLGELAGATFSSAFGINNAGDVVGWSGFTAFVWTPSGGMQNLNDLIPPNSGWSLSLAMSINDRGQITGQGTINGEQHAFLLTPVSEARH
jgi:probable HAF family extracellular repeat protein